MTETHDKRTETHACDLISRRAAIEALGEKPEGDDEWSSGCRSQWEWDTEILKTMPSAQPECEDAVSRDALDILIEETQTAWLRGDILLMYPALKKGLKKVPPVTPKQPVWIPWDSGKFPEESGTYTVTAYDGATKRVTYAKYQKRLKRWELTGARAYWRVLAWQPKPKPWEGEENR